MDYATGGTLLQALIILFIAPEDDGTTDADRQLSFLVGKHMHTAVALSKLAKNRIAAVHDAAVTVRFVPGALVVCGLIIVPGLITAACVPERAIYCNVAAGGCGGCCGGSQPSRMGSKVRQCKIMAQASNAR